jgi:hypothetical protein
MSVSIPKEKQSAVGWQLRRIEDAYRFNEHIGKATCAEKNQQFRDQCEELGIEPTPRQYAKWSKKIKRWK